MVIKNKLLVLLIICFIVIAIMPTCVKAIDIINNPDDYRPNYIRNSDTELIVSKANKILGVITTIGIVASVITLMILGVKYMMGSVEQKAEYKKSMIPYIIGIIILFSISTIVSIISTYTQNAFNIQVEEQTNTNYKPNTEIDLQGWKK